MKLRSKNKAKLGKKGVLWLKQELQCIIFLPVHNMKAYGGRGETVTLSLNLGTSSAELSALLPCRFTPNTGAQSTNFT